jgi:hypothetical protein
VQDRYRDDVGQFLKVALLRWLASPSPFGRGHRLGVIWLQEPGGGHRLDGDHLAYLHSNHDTDADLRSLDSALYDQLRLMAAQSGRPVSARETCRALPSDTVRFDRPLRSDDHTRDDRAARVVRRQRWFHEAMVAVSGCSLVFLDSDDGHVGTDEQPGISDWAEGCIWMSEVGQLLQRGQSVVTHHLVDPARSASESARAHLCTVHEALDVEPTVMAQSANGRVRLFTVIPGERDRLDLQHRIGALQLSRWGDEFRVYRWLGELATA